MIVLKIVYIYISFLSLSSANSVIHQIASVRNQMLFPHHSTNSSSVLGDVKSIFFSFLLEREFLKVKCFSW